MNKCEFSASFPYNCHVITQLFCVIIRREWQAITWKLIRIIVIFVTGRENSFFVIVHETQSSARLMTKKLSRPCYEFNFLVLQLPRMQDLARSLPFVVKFFAPTQRKKKLFRPLFKCMGFLQLCRLCSRQKIYKSKKVNFTRQCPPKIGQKKG